MQKHTKYLLATLWVLGVFISIENIVYGFVILGIFSIILALSVKALRKALGLLLIVLGIVSCFSGIGLIIGIPMVFIGGVLIFI